MCDRTVRFIIPRDRDGTRFRFAPLGGETFARSFDPETARRLPNSVVVLTAEGAVLVRAAAVRYILRRLGGAWRLLAALSAIVPTAIADRLYDVVARHRHLLIRTPPDACPVPPPELKSRFSR